MRLVLSVYKPFTADFLVLSSAIWTVIFCIYDLLILNCVIFNIVGK